MPLIELIEKVILERQHHDVGPYLYALPAYDVVKRMDERVEPIGEALVEIVNREGVKAPLWRQGSAATAVQRK